MATDLTLTIDELSPGGDGVAIVDVRGERRAVFLGGVLPGETVRARVDFKSRPARGELLSVLEPSKERVEPACKYVSSCGGCDWMHIAPSAQLTEHARIVSKLLGVPVDKSHSVRDLGYRSRARVHIHAKKGRVVVGMFAKRSHDPTPVETCVVLEPNLDRLRALLPQLLAGANGRGEARISAPGVMDIHFDGDELPAAVFGRLEAAVKDGSIKGARIFLKDARVPASIGEPTPSLRGADGELLRLAPGGFAQATEEGNTILGQRVLALAGDLSPCVELYAGAGNLSVLLARGGRQLTTVEQDREACEAARANLAARKLEAKVVEADASAFAIPKPTKLVVLDPPRQGARAICEALASKPHQRPRIVYVACDPPTLARDVAILTRVGWKIDTVETVEMFPQTSHVETVVRLQ